MVEATSAIGLVAGRPACPLMRASQPIDFADVGIAATAIHTQSRSLEAARRGGAATPWVQARVAKAVDDFVLLGKGDGRYVSPTTKTYVRLHLADFVVRLDVYPDRLHVDVVGVFAKL